MKKQKQNEIKQCPICQKDAEIYTREILPKDALYQVARHVDGKKEHTWLQCFFSDGLPSIMKSTIDPKYATCPKCGEKGMVLYFRRNWKRPEIVTYYIQHEEKIGGTWGKSKLAKKKRCWLTGDMRTELVKQLGRHVKD